MPSIFANQAATSYDPAVTGLVAGDTFIYNQGYGDLAIEQASGGTLAFGRASDPV